MQAHNFAVPHELLLEFCPDFVILNIGGNDLAQGTSPLVVASAVVQMGERLVRDYAVRDGIICSTIPRTGHLHGITRTCTLQMLLSSTNACAIFAMLIPFCIIILIGDFGITTLLCGLMMVAILILPLDTENTSSSQAARAHHVIGSPMNQNLAWPISSLVRGHQHDLVTGECWKLVTY